MVSCRYSIFESNQDLCRRKEESLDSLSRVEPTKKKNLSSRN